MRHTEESIKRVKKSLAEMWLLVQGQVEKVSAALLERNRELALEVRSREKMVDAYELTVDRECENFFALLTPVAVDLRMMLSIVKINNNLERIGDFADGIAVFVVENLNDKITPELIERLELKRMFQETLCMLSLCKAALANEDSAMAGKVFAKDNLVDRRRDRRAGRAHERASRRDRGLSAPAFCDPPHRTYRRPVQQHRRGHRVLSGSAGTQTPRYRTGRREVTARPKSSGFSRYPRNLPCAGSGLRHPSGAVSPHLDTGTSGYSNEGKRFNISLIRTAVRGIGSATVRPTTSRARAMSPINRTT